MPIVNATAPSEPCERFYTVVRGDTLSLIAGRVLGDVRAFNRLYALNRQVIGPDPATLEVGTVLRLPCAEPQTRAGVPETLPTELRGGGLGPVVVAPLGVGTRIATRGIATIGARALSARITRDRRLQVVDIRDGEGVGRTFVPRALVLPRASWPRVERHVAFLAERGVRPGGPVAIVAADGSRRSLARAAFAAWAMHQAGVEEVLLLRGGQAAWERARRPLWASPATPQPQRFARAGLSADLPKAGTPVLSAGHEVVSIGAPMAGAIEAPPLPDVAALIAAGREREAALSALIWLKAVPASWESAPVLLTAPDPDEAALAWLLASAFAGVTGVGLLPPEMRGADGEQNEGG